MSKAGGVGFFIAGVVLLLLGLLLRSRLIERILDVLGWLVIIIGVLIVVIGLVGIFTSGRGKETQE